MTRDVLGDFGRKAWGTPPGQTGGVYRIWGWRLVAAPMASAASS